MSCVNNSINKYICAGKERVRRISINLLAGAITDNKTKVVDKQDIPMPLFQTQLSTGFRRSKKPISILLTKKSIVNKGTVRDKTS